MTAIHLRDEAFFDNNLKGKTHFYGNLQREDPP